MPYPSCMTNVGLCIISNTSCTPLQGKHKPGGQATIQQRDSCEHSTVTTIFRAMRQVPTWRHDSPQRRLVHYSPNKVLDFMFVVKFT